MPEMPKNLREVDRLKAMSSYKDDPKLSPEENQKRKEHYAKMEEYLKNKKDSGFDFFSKLEIEIPGVTVVHLEQNHRHRIVDPILKVFSSYRD